MKLTSDITCVLLFILVSFAHASQGQQSVDRIHPGDSTSVTVERLDLFDYSRNRSVPVALYLPDTLSLKQKLIVFSHGYGENKGNSNLAYSYLNNFLAQHGYLVASIQHELPSDDPLSMKGKLRETRMPNWENGMQNILFVVKELKSRMPSVDDKRFSLIGHSNGGDMSMYFATEYPKKVSKVISLDNRRMPLPKLDSLKVYSLRSSDEPADEGVLPSLEQQRKHGVTIVTLSHTKHNEMCDDSATEEQKKEICEYVLKFLEEKSSQK